MQFRDRITQHPNRVRHVNVATGEETVYDVVRDEGNITDVGTPLNADNLNAITSDLKAELVNLIYPVGAVYLSLVNISPTSFLGGNWEMLDAASYLCTATSGVTNNNEANGGSSTITIDNMPTHDHSIYFDAYPNNAIGGPSSGSAHPNSTTLNINTWNASARTNTLRVGEKGSSSPYYPIFKNVYVWRRVS